MKIRSFVDIPQIRHGQKLRIKSVDSYFSEVKIWIQFANKRMAQLKFEKGASLNLSDRADKIYQGITSIKRDLNWLEKKGFADDELKDDLLTLEECLDDLFAELDKRADLRFDRDSDLY